MASKWLNVFPFGKVTVILLALAFLSRTVVGVGLYLSIQDPRYFSNGGVYITDNWEFYWTYESASYAADNLELYGEWRPTVIFADGENKNAAIHTWMGWFLAATGSRHALDLSPLNSFHNILAALFLVALALDLNYSVRAALTSGILLAWYPWSFPASLMWRDQIGLSWLLLATLLLCVGLRTRIVGIIAIAVAVVVAASVREVYGIVFMVVGVISPFVSQHSSSGAKKTAVLVGTLAGLLVVTYPQIYVTVIPIRYASFMGDLLRRITVLPLLFLRALAGPFPWKVFFDTTSRDVAYLLFDYMYHVLQLAITIVIALNLRRFAGKLDLLVVTWLALWITGIFAPGVHTAYLAVATPLIFPFVIDYLPSWRTSLLVSMSAFIFLNAAYVLSGWWGRGLFIGITGY